MAEDKSGAQARRLRRPSWRDGRLLVGVLLILGSMLLGAKVVAAARDTVPAYAAATALVPGERLTADRLTRVDVALGTAMSTYLAADRPLPVDAVVAREVRAGELVPASALVSGVDAGRTPVMVAVSFDSARVLVPGSTVNVWISDRVPGPGVAQYAPPKQAIESAPVSRVPGQDDGRLTGSGTVGVQIMVPPSDVARLLAATDQGARIALVPTAGSTQRGS